jgi:hypothetical protein
MITYEVARSEIVSRHGQDLANNGDAAARDNVEASLVCLATVPRVGNGIDTGQEVRRRGE